MKKFIDHLSTFVLWATLVIFVVIGGLAGYAAGDELLSSTEFIRPEDIGCSQMCFSFTYTGNWISISFMDIILWDDDNDLRQFNEFTNEYEPLKDYVLRQFDLYVRNINKFHKSYAKV